MTWYTIFESNECDNCGHTEIRRIAGKAGEVTINLYLQGGKMWLGENEGNFTFQNSATKQNIRKWKFVLMAMQNALSKFREEL